jgi:peptidoglycan/LPS O-acetylase OafA/YrhL
LLRGGLAGVDIFFVISGFLITGIILREYQAKGGIDFAGFWARRARRILPAATLVLLFTALLTPFFVSPLLIKQVGRDILAAGYFGLNWRAANRAVDYSAPGDDASPVLHYWSLAVEEQFYLAWPLILGLIFFAARKLNVNAMRLMLGLALPLAVASLVYCIMLTSSNQPLAFFGTFTRVWQLLTGGVLAAIVLQKHTASPALASFLGPLGLLVLLGSFFAIDPERAFPGWIASFPVLGAAALIYAGTAIGTENWGTRFVSIRPLTYMGKVSYVWYLWHWPVLFFGGIAYPDHGLLLSGFLVALSFALAVETHYAFENPVRFNPRLTASRLLSLVMGVVLVLGSVGAGFALNRYARAQTVELSDGGSLLIEDVLSDRSPAYRSDCHVSQLETAHERCQFGKENVKPEIVLFGDSHAAHFFNALEAAAISRNQSFLMRSKSGCPSLLGPLWNNKFKRQYIECDKWRAGVLATIAEEKPRLVILSNAVLHGMMEEGANGPAEETARQELYRTALTRMMTELLKYAGHVVLIEDTPRLPVEPLVCLHDNPRNEKQCAWPMASVTTGDTYIPDLSQFGSRVSIVDLNPLICPQSACQAVMGDKAIFYDQSHITASFSEMLAPAFASILEKAGL